MNVTSEGFIGIAEGFHMMVFAFSEARTGSGSNYSIVKITVSLAEDKFEALKTSKK